MLPFKQPRADDTEAPHHDHAIAPSPSASSANVSHSQPVFATPQHARPSCAASTPATAPRTPPSNLTPHPATPACQRHCARDDDSPHWVAKTSRRRFSFSRDAREGPPEREAAAAGGCVVSSSPAAPIIAESMHCISMSSFMPFALHYPFYLQAHRANKLQLETQFPHRLFDPTSNVLSDALQRIYAEFCSNASLGPRQRRFVVSASHLSVILARKLLQGSCRTLYPGHRLQHAIRIVSRLHRNVFSPATCFTTLPGSDGAHSVAFHPFLPFLATGSCDNTARVWRFLHPNAVDGLTQSLAVASLAGHSNSVKSVAFHPSLPYLATGSRDGSIKLWSLHCDGTPAAYVATLQGHTSSIKSVAFHPFLPVLASGSANRDNTARVWRFFHPQAAGVSSKSLVVASLEEHTVRHADSVKSVAFHPSLPYMATGSRDRTAEWLCLSPDGTPIWPSLTLHGHSSSINSVAFHTTAPILATGSYDGSTKLWKHDGSAVSCVGTLEHAKCIMSVAFHPCVPNVLATGSTDGSAKLWQLRFDEDDELIRHTCKHLVHTDGPIKSVAFHARLPVMATRCHVDGRDTTTLWW